MSEKFSFTDEASPLQLSLDPLIQPDLRSPTIDVNIEHDISLSILFYESASSHNLKYLNDEINLKSMDPDNSCLMKLSKVNCIINFDQNIQLSEPNFPLSVENVITTTVSSPVIDSVDSIESLRHS